MGTTTFSGPIKSGTIKETSGTTVGSNMKNTGFVVLSQTAAIDQTATTTTTNIIIPPTMAEHRHGRSQADRDHSKHWQRRWCCDGCLCSKQQRHIIYWWGFGPTSNL